MATVIIILAVIHFINSFFVAREEHRLHQGEKFWKIMHWIPFANICFFIRREKKGILLLAGYVILAAGLIYVTGFIPDMQVENMINDVDKTSDIIVSTGAITAISIILYAICGAVFVSPYIKAVVPKFSIADKIYLTSISTIGILYYAVFIHSREDYPSKRKIQKELRQYEEEKEAAGVQ